MRLVGVLLALACVTGCGGTVVLQSGTRPAPVPVPVPCHDCGWIDRDEAVRIVRVEASRQQIDRLRVDEIRRKQHDWRIEGRGLDSCGLRVEVRARVDRRTGDIESFQVRGHDKHRHRHGHHDHDGDDD